MAAHAPPHHDPAKAHAHGHHHHHAVPGSGRYSIALTVNLAYVAIEAGAGFFANSTALLSDAAHNLSDVLGLALAGAAAWLATRAKGGARRTYGFAKAGVLAALANALLLVAASGAIAWEAARRLAHPPEIAPAIVIAVAAIGLVINTGSALLFAGDRKHDLNARGAFLHLASDAAVSLAVVAAGFMVLATGQAWIDPALSLIVVVVILWSAFALARDSLDLALDAAPEGIDVRAVRAHLEGAPGVASVHDLHVWAMSAREPALTAHLVRPDGGDDAFLCALTDSLAHEFGIRHVTLQVERVARDGCAEGHA